MAWPERIVVLHVATRLLTLAGGAAIVLFVALKLPAAEQGIYFTFAAAFQMMAFVEQGLGATVVQFAGRAAEGDEAERAGLARSATAWYQRAAAMIVVLLAPVAWIVTARAPGHRGRVALLWILLVIVIATYALVVPRLTAFEGWHDVSSLQRMRIRQAIGDPLTILALLYFAGPEAAVLGGAAVHLGIALSWLAGPQKDFAARWNEWIRAGQPRRRPAFQTAQTQSLVSWLSPVLAGQGLVWAILAGLGPVAAGQAGMTITLGTAPHVVAMAWLLGRFPRFGRLAERGEWAELDALASRATRDAMAICLLGSVGIVGMTVLLGRDLPSMATRMLTWWATGALCLYNLAYTWYMGRAGQARSAGVEWLRWPPALGAVAAMAAVSSALVAGAGVDAVMTAFVAGGLVGVVPLTWMRHRTLWRDLITDGRVVVGKPGVRT